MKIAVVSANKEDNLGDRLIYESLSSYLNSLGHDVCPINFRLQYNDGVTAKLRGGQTKEFLKRLTLIYLLLQIVFFLLRIPKYIFNCRGYYKECDIVLIGGGQLLMDSNKSILGPINMLLHVCLARYYVGRYSFVGIGIANNFNYSVSRKIFKYCLNKADTIICRDVFSFNRALLQVPDTNKVKYGADLALLLKMDEFIDKAHDLPRLPVVGISTLAYYDQRYFPLFSDDIFSEYKRRIGRIIREFNSAGYKSTLIPTTSIDYIVAKEINSDLVLHSNSVGMLIRNIRRCDLFVATRMHSYIIATLLGVPAICMNWDDKVLGYTYGLAGFNSNKYIFNFSEMESAEFILEKIHTISFQDNSKLIGINRRNLKKLIDEIVS